MFETMAQGVLGDHMVGANLDPPLGPSGCMRSEIEAMAAAGVRSQAHLQEH